MPTLTQLSEDLGVSTSTISRVLNNDSTLNINDVTRKNIIQYANEVGYISKISKSKPILMLYHCISKEQDDEIDPFFKEIKDAVIQICNEKKITLLNYRRGEIPNTTSNINGIIAIGTYSNKEIAILGNYSKNISFINS
ncbi:MAG: LacI family DNA-binding transcriptional regulator [Erysipelotrichaceae bacterium]